MASPAKESDRNDRIEGALALSGKVRISMNLVRAITDRVFGYDVFVSYSRKDGMTYAQQLEKDLLRNRLRCFLDSEEMPPGESLHLSLRGALRRSSAIVLVASPGALQSPYMPVEFDYYMDARKHPKILPISIGRALDDAPADSPLRQRVRDRIDTVWVSERPEQLSVGPSAEVLGSLIRSFRFTRRNVIRQRVVTLVGVILGLLAIVAFWMAYSADQAKKSAQKALTTSFVRTIGGSKDNEQETPNERAALWELAELDLENEPVREKVIDHWFQTEESIGRALKRQAQGLHSAVGLNLGMRNHSASKATEMADRLAKALENMPETMPETNAYSPYRLGDALATNAYSLSRLGDVLAALAAGIEPKEAARVAAQGAQVLAKALENPQETDADRLSRLGDALAALAAGIEPKEAAHVSDGLAKALENTPETDADRLSILGDALAALAARMEPKEAARVAAQGAQGLAKALENTPETDPGSLSKLGDALAALAARMEPKEAARVAAQGAQVFAKALENKPETDAISLSILGHALAALAARMEPKEAARVSDSLAKALENKPETDAISLSILGDALAALAARMEPKEAARVAAQGAQVFAKALENKPETDADRPSILGDALAALAARMEPKEAARVADGLAKALENKPETDADRLSILGDALAALAARMEPKEAARVAAQGAQVLAKALENPQETDADRLSRLGDALAALAARMEPKEAARVAAQGAQVLAKALENALATNVYSLSRLGDAMAALAAGIEPKEAARVAAQGAQVLAKALENAPEIDADSLSTLGWSLGGLSRLIPPARQTRFVALSIILLNQVPDPPKAGTVEPKKRKQLAELYALLEKQDLVDVLKWPLCVGENQKLALATLENKTGRKFDDDLWKFVEQAPSRGITHLDKPPKQPQIEDAVNELKKLRTGAADKPSVQDTNKPSTQ